MTHNIAALFLVRAHILAARTKEASRDERGLVLVEWLLIIAGAVIITGAVIGAYQAFSGRKIAILNGA